MEYVISVKAIHAIKNHPTLIGLILAANNRNETKTVRAWLNRNEPNGPLTTKANIDLIMAETGLPESEILTQSKKEGHPLPYPVEMNNVDQTSDK